MLVIIRSLAKELVYAEKDEYDNDVSYLLDVRNGLHKICFIKRDERAKYVYDFDVKKCLSIMVAFYYKEKEYCFVLHNYTGPEKTYRYHIGMVEDDGQIMYLPIPPVHNKLLFKLYQTIHQTYAARKSE